ncbi:hypothetical protein ACM9HB_29125 [Streptomyces sp. JAC128]|uniref:hypothetical protein n=1 Tax=Streptomyces sp. JAC128 TaxID=3418412 RepID=UPI003D8170FF
MIERHVTRRGSGLARYLDLRSRSVLRPGWPPAERFAHHLIDDAAAVTGADWTHSYHVSRAGRVALAHLRAVPRAVA